MVQAVIVVGIVLFVILILLWTYLQGSQFQERFLGYRLMFDYNKQPLVLLDAKGKIWLINKAAGNLLPTGFAGAKGKKVEDCFPGEAGIQLGEFVEQVILEGKPQEVELNFRSGPSDRWYGVSLQAAKSRKGLARGVVCTFFNITQRKRAEKELLKSLKDQEFMVKFSNYLISVEHFDQKVDNALHALGHYSGLSRIYIFEDHGNGRMMRNTHEWAKEGVLEQKQDLQRLSHALHLPGIRDALLRDGLICSSDTSFLPASMKEILETRNVKSILVLPIHVDSRYHGFIGFDACEVHRYWEDIEIGFLKAIALVISSAFERKHAHIEIAKSEGQFRNLFNNSSDAIFIYDTGGRILEVNLAATRKMGLSRETILSKNIREILSGSPEDKDEWLIPTGEEECIIFEERLVTRQGDIVHVEISNRIIEYLGKQVVISSMRDITERKQMEREILSAIIQTEEKERERVAKDLHDGLGPLLSSIKLYVKVLSKADQPVKKNRMVVSTNQVVEEAIQLIKEISNNLSPHVLNDFGLATAISSFCRKISISREVKIQFESNVAGVRFDPNLEIIVFRVCKELVNNTIKHASAKHIEIFLMRVEDILHMVYSDDGTGFDFQEALQRDNTGMGLSNIMSRVESIDGRMSFDTAEGRGTRVSIEFGLNVV